MSIRLPMVVPRTSSLNLEGARCGRRREALRRDIGSFSGRLSWALALLLYTRTHGNPEMIRTYWSASLRIAALALFFLLAADLPAAEGKKLFAPRCAGCHGSDALGRGNGPGLSGNPRLSGLSVEQLRAIVQRGFPTSGMPAFHLPLEELDAIAVFVRGLNAGVTIAPPAGKRVAWGKPAPGDWLTYNGNLSASAICYIAPFAGLLSADRGFIRLL